MEEVIAYAIVYLIVLVITLYIAKAIFGLSSMQEKLQTQTDCLKLMYRVLNKVAEKQGVTLEELQKTHDDVAKETSPNYIRPPFQ